MPYKALWNAGKKWHSDRDTLYYQSQMSWAWIKYTFRLIEQNSNKAFTINLNLLIVWKLNIKLGSIMSVHNHNFCCGKIFWCGQRWKYLFSLLITSSWQFWNLNSNQNILFKFWTDCTNFYLEEAWLYWLVKSTISFHASI